MIAEALWITSLAWQVEMWSNIMVFKKGSNSFLSFSRGNVAVSSVCKAVQLRQILFDLGLEPVSATMLYSDKPVMLHFVV